MENIVLKALICCLFLNIPIYAQKKASLVPKELSVKQIAALIGLLKVFTPPRTLGYFKDGKFVAPSIR